MAKAEVNGLIKAPDALMRHESNKRWIPFYFGEDAQRMQELYASENCLTDTGDTVFDGDGNQFIRITAKPTPAYSIKRTLMGGDGTPAAAHQAYCDSVCLDCVIFSQDRQHGGFNMTFNPSKTRLP